MKLRGRHKRKADGYSTIIFMSRSSKTPRSFHFSKRLKYVVLSLVLIITFYASQSIYNYMNYVQALEEENASASTVINGLEESIVERDTRINDLENTTDEQYATLNDLQKQSSEVIHTLNTLQEAKDDLEEKLNHEDKTTDTKPISSASEESLPILGIRDDSYEDIPILSARKVDERILRTSKNISNSFEVQADLLYNDLVKTQTRIENETSDLTTMDQEADVLIPYWRAYPSIYPTNGRLTSTFGWRKNPRGYGMEYHIGIDMSNTYGANVYATGSGVVTKAEYSPSYGYYVEINHGYGITTKSAHHSRLCVKVGQIVEKGDVIAKIGSTGYSTGPHTHYEIRVNGEAQNPFNFIQ